MKPMLGWTMLNRDDVRHAERALANNEQETRDEIGFLLIHQGIADRLFPGTSVLHTRLRYALFIPWIYKQAAKAPRRGRDMEGRIQDLLIDLAIRLNKEEKRGVIGGDKPGQITAQPPDRSYWSALRSWGIVLGDVQSRADALARLRSAVSASAEDDDGGRLDEVPNEAFCGLPRPPHGWEDRTQSLNFNLPPGEREFLRGKLNQLTRPDGQPALLARLVDGKRAIVDNLDGLPRALDEYADDLDREALAVARDAAALSAVGRAVYGALVEELIAQDGGKKDRIFGSLLPSHFESYGEAAGRCDLDAAERLLPHVRGFVSTVLRRTQNYVRRKKPEDFFELLECYRFAEVKRKTTRARLANTPQAADRRSGWVSSKHNVEPIHYRWRVVAAMLKDLSETP